MLELKKIDVYTECPQFENERYLLRLLIWDDLADLLKVYSDEKAVPFFNGDNCNGDTFYYQTQERMEQAIDFWLMEYSRRGFVRWTIVDKNKKNAVGTIELFHRGQDGKFPECGLMRLDLGSDYEREQEIDSILSLILDPACDLFSCERIATKARPEAVERISSLVKNGFRLSGEKLTGHDGTTYGDYYIWKKETR